MKRKRIRGTDEGGNDERLSVLVVVDTLGDQVPLFVGGSIAVFLLNGDEVLPEISGLKVDEETFSIGGLYLASVLLLARGERANLDLSTGESAGSSVVSLHRLGNG